MGLDHDRTGTRRSARGWAKWRRVTILAPTVADARHRDDADRAEAKLTLDALISEWASRHLSQRRPRYAAEAVRALRFIFAGQLKQPAARLTRATVIAALDRLVETGKKTMAGRTMSYGRAMYSWAVKRELVSSNPFHEIPIPPATAQRDVLTTPELAEIVGALRETPYPFGPFYLLALLTLQRREEVSGMKWSELSSDLTTWTIPAGRIKPQSSRRASVRSGPRDSSIYSPHERLRLCFHDERRNIKHRLLACEASLGRADRRTKRRSDNGAMALHDFRRTGVSKLADLGVDSIVADKLLAHKPTRLAGVASVYQRHEFRDERKRALEAWAKHVEGLRA